MTRLVIPILSLLFYAIPVSPSSIPEYFIYLSLILFSCDKISMFGTDMQNVIFIPPRPAENLFHAIYQVRCCYRFVLTSSHYIFMYISRSIASFPVLPCSSYVTRATKCTEATIVNWSETSCKVVARILTRGATAAGVYL